jgi:hypothetical protein
MAIQIATDKAVLTVSDSSARPGSQVDTTRGFLFGHLSQGWNGSDWVADAITCSATVPVAGPQSEVDRLELGFVQIARAVSFQAFYAGRIHSEGGIALNYFVPPALTTAVLLDGASRNARNPWYRNPVFALGGGNRRAADTGDHPGMVVRLSLENRVRSNVRNFLFHCFMEREFWTILTALEPGGQPRYIAHFQWRLRYEFKLTWRNSNPNPPVNLSSIRVITRQAAGRPTDADLQAMLNNPSGERANSVGARVEAATVTGNVPNRTDNATRFSTVPDGFWT